MSTYTLTYRKDRSQEICVETIENVGKDVNLYFNQEYDEAIKLIKEIIVLQGIRDEEECRERNEDANNKPNNKRDVAKYGCNNRILFAGQRGCGKTSVMRSLAEYLAKHKITINYDGDKDDVKVRCCCLPMVDPSHFDNNNNILLTVITSMFSVAKGYMKEFGDKNDTADREDLLRQFETVFKSLDSIKSEITSYTLESLNRKSDAEDLRKKMNDLVAKYLKYIVGDKESRLVLLIDDIDMSVSYAPEMLEQLRKYLELDNLIILMSANLGQLSNEMREKYSSAFQYTLKDSNQALSIDVEDLATKYLLKLFPTSRRVNVERHVDQLLKTRLRIMGNKHNGQGEEKNVVEDNFQKVILSLIWSKTRLLFIPKDPENTLHPIIPTNLRDLAQFLDMLTTLDKVESGENNLFKNYDEYDKCNKNLQLFKRYVMHTWIPNHLAIEEELVFKNIPTDITEINKHLINSINVIGTMHKTRLMSREVSLDMIERNAENVNIDRDIYTMVSPNDPKFVKANKISDIFNQPSNYSYGDLLLMIDKYETYFESEEHRRFTDAIKIYYSILLFETMFFKSQNVDYSFVDKKIYEVIPVQKLIGGNVYYPNYFEIITDKNFNQKGPSFDAKRAFYHKVKVDREKDDKVGEKYPLFAVLYYGDIRPDRYEKDHIYDTTFSNNADVDGVKYVTFDILSILNNMLNPCHTLGRLDEKNFKPCNWGTIVNDIKQWGKENTIGDMSVPNAILPFYSVDIMLQYLKSSISVDNSKEDLEVMKEINNSDSYTLLSFSEKDKLMKLLNDIKDDIKISEKDYFENTEKYKSLEIPEENRTILSDVLNVYYKLSYNNCSNSRLYKKYSIADSYRDYIMASILKNFTGSTRERELILKNLHKYDTCSEIIKYLFSVLCKDAYRETKVRISVQEAVHSYEFVHYYYNKLWNNTQRMLENVKIDIGEDTNAGSVRVYESIYNNAIRCFVMAPQDVNSSQHGE